MNRKATLILGPCTAVALSLSGYGGANASESSTVSYEGSVSASSAEYISDSTEGERTLAGLDRMTSRGSVGPGSSLDRSRDLGSSLDRSRDLGSSLDRGGDRLRDRGSSFDRPGDRSRDVGSSLDRGGDSTRDPGSSSRPGDGIRGNDPLLDEALILDERRSGPGFYERVCERAVWPQAWQEGWCEGWWTV